MTLFRKKYRVESSRLTGWDYSSPGYYFVTICTHRRKCILSEIRNETVILSPIGKIVEEEWVKTGIIRKNVLIDEYRIMPNHVHGILQIKQSPWHVGSPDLPVVETPWHGVSTTEKPTAEKPINTGIPEIPPPNGSDLPYWKPGVLGAIIGQFKTQVSKRARRAGFPDFQWQSRFHDHIIRDRDELFRIRRYIINNPANWNRDTFNTDYGDTTRKENREGEQEIWLI